ncbi:hypothetical protein D3C72_1982870 [compost metagenome]
MGKRECVRNKMLAVQRFSGTKRTEHDPQRRVQRRDRQNNQNDIAPDQTDKIPKFASYHWIMSSCLNELVRR